MGDEHEISGRQVALIAELRRRLGDSALPATCSSNFDLWRWLNNAEKLVGAHHQKNHVVDVAEKQLRHHLRFRKALKLDEDGTVPPLQENPLFKERLIPNGCVHLLESCNKFLWWSDYGTLDMVGLMKSVRSSDMLVHHFWLYDRLLRLVQDRERCTGRASGLVGVVNMDGYDFNPFTLLFFNNGQMSHYIQLFHYEHYPSLVHPIYAINVPRWLYYPYKMVRPMLPRDINDRVRILDHNFKHTLKTELDERELPEYLGGLVADVTLKTVPARHFAANEYYALRNDDPAPQREQCTLVQVGARRRKFVPVKVPHAGAVIRFAFTSDAELLFGVFARAEHEPFDAAAAAAAAPDTEQLTMVRPPLWLGAKHVPESGSVVCDFAGVYFFLFCNKHSWLTRRNVHLKLNLSVGKEVRNCTLFRMLSTS